MRSQESGSLRAALTQSRAATERGECICGRAAQPAITALYYGIMLNRLLAGAGLALAMSSIAMTPGASRTGESGSVQDASDAPRIDTVGTYKGRLALTDTGMLFRPCRLASPYPLEYAGGTRAVVYERARWLMHRPRDELFVVLQGKLVARGPKTAKKAKTTGETLSESKAARDSRSHVQFLVNRVDSIRVLRLGECAAPRPRG
jgi:hypothetical protein